MQNIIIETQYDRQISLLKKGIWVYFILLIFEGALRKWILPGLATPLLLVRDPVAMYILIKAIYYNIWKPNNYVIVMWLTTTFAFITALITGHGDIFIAVYGARITLIHFPLIFIIGHILNKEDVIKMGVVMLWLTIMMTILIAVQFYSPQSALVNRGIGGDEAGSGFSGAEGFFRVPGTFSFTNGLAAFYSLATAFIIYFWVNINEIRSSKKILILSTVALFAAVPLSISRTVFFSICISLVFLIAISTKKPKFITQIFAGIVVSAVLFVFFNNFSFFQTASSAFTERFTSANKIEGGVESVFLDRFLGGMFSAITEGESSFFGLGLGLGTNAGSKLLTGSVTYLVSEGEWGRLIGEMGFVLGMIMIILRSIFVFDLTKKSWISAIRNNSMPWMLLSFGIIMIIQGLWAQPTALGFSVLAGGFIIASLKTKK